MRKHTQNLKRRIVFNMPINRADPQLLRLVCDGLQAQGIPGSLFCRIGDHPTLRSCPSDLRTHLRSAEIPSQDPGLAEAAELQSYFAVEGKEVEGLGRYGMLWDAFLNG